MSQTAYDIYQKNKFAENSLYFHHAYAETDIPIGQQYEAIAFSKGWKIQSNSIQKCHSRILCFLRRLGHAHQTVRCEEIMNLV